MNRGRHKKSKEKEFNTQAEILYTIQKKTSCIIIKIQKSIDIQY